MVGFFYCNYFVNTYSTSIKIGLTFSFILFFSLMVSAFLATQNFKIHSTGWKPLETTWVVAGKKATITVKVNPELDVWEYVSWVPASFIGQQVFTYGAALRETQKAGKSLPADQSVLEAAITTMPGDNELQKYKNYLVKTNVQLAGCYSSGSHVFDDISTWAYYWLDDGSRVNLNATTRGVARRDETMGYSVRTN